MIDLTPCFAAKGYFPLAASIGVSLALHLAIVAGVSATVVSGGYSAQYPERLALEVALPDAQPASKPASEAVPLLGNPTAASPFGAAKPDRERAGIQSKPVEQPSFSLPIPEPQFFRITELDTPPTVIRDIAPDPPELQQHPQGGKLTLQLWIDDEGKVVKVDVLASDLPDPFAESARQSFMDVLFAPAKKDGVVVRARVRIEVVYPPRR